MIIKKFFHWSAKIIDISISKWDKLSINISKPSNQYRNCSHEDLLVSCFR